MMKFKCLLDGDSDKITHIFDRKQLKIYEAKEYKESLTVVFKIDAGKLKAKRNFTVDFCSSLESAKNIAQSFVVNELQQGCYWSRYQVLINFTKNNNLLIESKYIKAFDARIKKDAQKKVSEHKEYLTEVIADLKEAQKDLDKANAELKALIEGGNK